jgi:hypothetical protein
MEVAGASRRRCFAFRRRGRYFNSAVAQLYPLGHVKVGYLFVYCVYLLTAGCSTYYRDQVAYEVHGVATNSADVTKIRGILQTVADKSGLKEVSETSSPYWIAFYQSGGVSLQAMNLSYRTNSVWIGLTDIHEVWVPQSHAYKKAGKILAVGLSDEFGNRVVVITK